MAEEVLLYKIGVEDLNSTEKIGVLKAQISELTAEVKKHTAEMVNLKKVDSEKAEALGKEILLRRDKVAALKDELAATIRQTESNNIEATSIVGMRKEAALLTKQIDSLNKEQRENANVGGVMKNRIVELDKAIKAHEQSLGNYRRSVGQYNTAGMAMSQVLREIPAFTFSAQTGILALSNNLPILADEFKKLSLSIDENTKKQTGFVGALKQMGANIFSFGSIMTIALGVFTIFSDKIFAWVSGAIKVDDKIKNLSETIGKNIGQTKLLTGIINDNNISQENRIIAAKKLLEIYPETLKNYSAEQIAAGEAAKAIDKITNSVIAYAKVKAIQTDIEKIAGEQWSKQQSIELKQAELLKEEARLRDANSRSGEVYAERADLALGKIQNLKIEIDDLTKSVNENEKQMNKLSKDASGLFPSILDEKQGGKNINSQKENNKKSLEAEIDYQKELLALIEQYHDLKIETSEDKTTKELRQEYEKHHRSLTELKSHLGNNLEVNKQVNKNIEEEQKRHEQEMLKIMLSKGGTETTDPTSGEAKRFEEATELLNKKEDKAKKERQAKAAKQDADDRIAAMKLSIDIAKQTVDTISKIKQDAIDRDLKLEMTAIQRNADKQDRILENQLRNGLISEGQYNDEKEKLNQQPAARELEAQKKAFEEKKKLDTVAALMNGALAITSILAQYPKFDGGFAMAGALVAATALTTAQVATIQRQEFALGGKIKGKSHAQGGVDVNVEGDEMIINKAAGRSNQVMSVAGTPSQIASAINSAYGGVSWDSTLSNQPRQNIFENNTSSQSITFAQMESLLIKQANMFNDKKVILTESDVTKTQKKVSMYEKNGKW